MVGFIPITIVNTTDFNDPSYSETPSIANIEQIKTIAFFKTGYAELYYIGAVSSSDTTTRGYVESWDFIKCDDKKRDAIIALLVELKLYHKLKKKDESTNDAQVRAGTPS